MHSTNDGAKRAMVYIRVASAEHGSEEQAQQQEVACRETAQRLGFTPVAVYSDIGSTERPGLRRMLDELDTIKPTSVITLDPSRFGRKYQENMAVMTRLRAAGVEPVFAHDPTEDPLGLSWRRSEASVVREADAK
ncbi:MAG TPA: recombinase family protein [Magnetospirillaceae bacterium]|nr:recombinase family protein [Magnetospirillaceae bacterium]